MTAKDDINQPMLGKITEREFHYRLIPLLLKHFTYKPNWFVEGEYKVDYDEVFITMREFVEDSTEEFEQWDLRPQQYIDRYDVEEQPRDYYGYKDLLVGNDYGRRRRAGVVSPRRPVLPVYSTAVVPRTIETESEFWFWLRYDGIPQLEEHEMDEWFKVDGMVMFDPHSTKPMFLTIQELEIRNRGKLNREFRRSSLKL